MGVIAFSCNGDGTSVEYLCVEDMTDVRAVPGVMREEGESVEEGGWDEMDGRGWVLMSSAGLGKVLNVEPREVYLGIYMLR
jgi:hypothetical protein